MHNACYQMSLSNSDNHGGECPICFHGVPPVSLQDTQMSTVEEQEQDGETTGTMPPSPHTPTDLAEQEAPSASAVAPPITPSPGQVQNARSTTAAPRIDLEDTLVADEVEGHVPDGDQQQRTTAAGLGVASEGSRGEPPQDKGADNEATQVGDPEPQLGDQPWVNGSCQPGGGDLALDDGMGTDEFALVPSAASTAANADDRKLSTVPSAEDLLLAETGKMCCRCCRFFVEKDMRNSNSKKTYKCKKCNSIDTVIERFL